MQVYAADCEANSGMLPDLSAHRPVLFHFQESGYVIDMATAAPTFSRSSPEALR